MASIDDYDGFDYKSSQNFFDIDYQIDLFELRHCVKSRKSKSKLKKRTYRRLTKSLESQRALLKISCMPDKITPKAPPKVFRHQRLQENAKIFECDEIYQDTSTNSSNTISTTDSSKEIIISKETKSSLETSKTLEDKHLQNFSNFRRHFYRVNRQNLLSSFKSHSHIKVIDIPKIEDTRGNLSVIEKSTIPFAIKRVYYLYDVPSNAYRGGHAHKQQQELLIALSGIFEVKLNDGKNSKSFMLNATLLSK